MHLVIHLPIISIGTLLYIACLFIFLPQQNLYSFRTETEVLAGFDELIAPTPAPLPVNKTGINVPPLTSEGIFIIDIPSNMTLLEKNPDIQFFPASTTKIMTALVALETYKLTDEVVINTVITEGQTMKLVKGEVITIENLLYGTLVHSANDAAYVLAQYYKGGIQAFLDRMNKKAQELHLTNTHFTNPIGFDDPNHFTTPRDLAHLAVTALQNPTFVKMVGIAQITVADTTFTHFHALKNVNELLGKVPGVYGVKTGWTQTAGQSLVSVIQRDNRKIATVVLKSNDRFGETEMLINWVFNNFVWQDMNVSNPTQIQ